MAADHPEADRIKHRCDVAYGALTTIVSWWI